jgi:16S rRNA processing protein RimM
VIDAGRVGRPHGLDGSFHVTRAVGDMLHVGGEVEVDGRRERIERRAGTVERPILRLEGAATREDAEALRGATLRVPDSLAPPLEEDEYWAHELEGCTVHDGPRDVGTVRRMITLPSCEALEVERTEGDVVLVPLVRDAIRAVDRDSRRIDVDMGFVGA